jgi:adenosylcobinamide kinase/adenosylcobinamide-phosphate guanylyltransferase
MTLTLLLGGVRAGKSARALDLAHLHAGTRNVLFVATAQAFDDEMRVRIAKHRAERPVHWATLESPVDLTGSIRSRLDDDPSYGVVLIDCLTLWVSNILLSLDDDVDAEAIVADRTAALLRMIALDATAAGDRRSWIVVSNEVGLGVVPPTPLGRRYRDALGRANQLVAGMADTVSLLVAGLTMNLKTPADEKER